ncbi:MAG: pseudouridine synthase [Spirochaetia bacterium]
MLENLPFITCDESGQKKIYILHEEESFAVIIKPRNLHCAPLSHSLPTLVDFVKKSIPSIMNVQGKSPLEGGLLHRLDYDTEGLVLFAKTQQFFEHILECSKKNLFIKYYLAHSNISDAVLSPDSYSLENWHKKLKINTLDGIYTLTNQFIKTQAKSSRVKPIIHDSRHATKQHYQTMFKFKSRSNCIHVHAQLSRGFRHQVRACLNSLGLPIIGDPMYPKIQTQSLPFCFWASMLEFPQIKDMQILCFKYEPD